MADIVDVDLFKFIDTDVKSRLYALAVQDVGSAYCGRGISKSRIGNNTGALSDFNAAIKIMPEHGSFYLARAAAYAEREEHAKAMQDLEVAIQLDGQNAEIHCMKAWVHFSEEEFSAALEEYSRTIELSPHWAAVYWLRGRVHTRLEDYQDAIDDFGKAIELGPRRAQTWHEPWHEPRPDVSAALDWDRPAAHAHRGLAYLLLGDEVRGREDIVEATELEYALSDIEDEIAALLSDERERRSMSDFVRNAMDGPRVDLKEHSWATSSEMRNSRRHRENDATSGSSSPKELLSLSKEAYTTMFEQLGFYDIKIGRTLKHPEPIPSIYFNSRYGTVYFVAYLKDRERFRPGFWRLVRPRRMKEDFGTIS